MSGYLTKQGHVIKNWKRRWCVIAHGTLYYYKDKQESEPLGIINLSGVTIHPADSIKKGSFELRTPVGKNFVMYGDTPEETQQWVAGLRALCDSLSVRLNTRRHRQSTAYWEEIDRSSLKFMDNEGDSGSQGSPDTPQWQKDEIQRMKDLQNQAMKKTEDLLRTLVHGGVFLKNGKEKWVWVNKVLEYICWRDHLPPQNAGAEAEPSSPSPTVVASPMSAAAALPTHLSPHTSPTSSRRSSLVAAHSPSSSRRLGSRRTGSVKMLAVSTVSKVVMGVHTCEDGEEDADLSDRSGLVSKLRSITLLKPNENCCFSIVCPKRVLVLEASTPEEATRWCKLFQFLIISNEDCSFT
eukprot:TRINITY_DN4997_c0_g1_i3.p1 TRINITY_DN4997_c0_g1~~TRINITY_DN4997_c0_g1_i3.p1  ORF type:complete len:352 (+),score=73.33 TRINITY_DN4997_c0_g1_i3:534-1589(+)